MLMMPNPFRKKVDDLADSAQSTLSTLRHAARDTREAVSPVTSEVRSLITHLQSTLENLGSERSSEGLRARAEQMADKVRTRTVDSMARARECVDGAVENVQDRVASSPLKALMIVAAVGALVGLVLAGRSGNDSKSDSEGG